MKVVLTGGAGFVGGAIARVLRARGDDVVALVRDPRSPAASRSSGPSSSRTTCRTSTAARRRSLNGADAGIHAAGSYRSGIPKSERGAMWDANVGTTTRFLDAAEAAGTKRIVYVSTINVFGNTHGKVVDETYRRDLADGFLSWYDETKYGAHEVVEQRIAGGAPIVIVLPSQVYGPGDHSSIGEQLSQANAGKLPYRALDDVGLGFVHVDDLASGIVAAARPGADRPLVHPLGTPLNARRGDGRRGVDRGPEATEPSDPDGPPADDGAAGSGSSARPTCAR